MYACRDRYEFKDHYTDAFDSWIQMEKQDFYEQTAILNRGCEKIQPDISEWVVNLENVISLKQEVYDLIYRPKGGYVV